MAIDDPKKAFEQQYIEEEQKLPSELAKIATKIVPADGGFVAEILLRVADAMNGRVSTRERLTALWEMLCLEVRHLEKTKVSQEDLVRAVQLAMAYDNLERDDKKRERYVKLIGNALRSEEEIQDVPSFIQNIEQLNERDLTVLKILNQVMNKQGDWRPQDNPGGQQIWRLHPSVINSRAQELTIQIAMGLGQSVERNTYAREEGYGICSRLHGFGLAHETETTRELPLTNYCFRPSLHGLRLLRLLGEAVPNYEHYLGR